MHSSVISAVSNLEKTRLSSSSPDSPWTFYIHPRKPEMSPGLKIIKRAVVLPYCNFMKTHLLSLSGKCHAELLKVLLKWRQTFLYPLWYIHWQRKALDIGFFPLVQVLWLLFMPLLFPKCLQTESYLSSTFLNNWAYWLVIPKITPLFSKCTVCPSSVHWNLSLSFLSCLPHPVL